MQTLWPIVAERLGKVEEAPPAADWDLLVDDGDGPPVRLTGRLRRSAGARALVLLVHGLGGSVESVYMRRAARRADAVGFASLRLNLRGSDREAFLRANGYEADLYHAGLSSDLAAVLADPALRDFDDLFVLGYSLGGHMTLKLATEDADQRLRAVAAVCPPVDLDRTVAGIDRPAAAVYRHWVFSGLHEVYGAVAARREVPISLEHARRIRRVREWDQRIVAPRFGFDSAEDYYARARVRLEDLRRPAFVVVGRADPMVLEDANREPLEAARGDLLQVRWVDGGGHVGFSPRLDLGLGPTLGVEGQVLDWFHGRMWER